MDIQDQVIRDISFHDEKLNAKKIKLIGAISFLVGFAQVFFLYIMSSYFKLISGIQNVGIFYFVAYSLILLILLNLHKLVKKVGKSHLFHLSLFFKILTILFLLFLPPSWVNIILVGLYIILGNIEWVSLDMILESYSTDAMSGRIRGGFLSLMNLGVLIGPFLSTWVLERKNYHGIFILLLIFNVIILFVGIFGLKKVNHRFREKAQMKDIIKKVIRRTNIRKIFYISFVLEFFYALMIIYTPIYLRNLGLSWESIGVIFTMMLLPFVFLQYPVGVLADRKLGEKEILIGSIGLMGITTIVIFFIGSTSLILWSIILFLTRVGASLVEILRDSYFYKRIDGHNIDLIDVFRAMRPVAYILATASSALVLAILPMKFIFILVGLIIFSALYPAIGLVDNLSEKELKK